MRFARVALVIVAVVCFGVALSYPIRYRLAQKSNDSALRRLSDMRSQAMEPSAAEAPGAGEPTDGSGPTGFSGAGEAAGDAGTAEAPGATRLDGAPPTATGDAAPIPAVIGTEDETEASAVEADGAGTAHVPENAIAPSGGAVTGEAIAPSDGAVTGEAIAPSDAAVTGEAIAPSDGAVTGEAIAPSDAAVTGEAIAPSGGAVTGAPADAVGAEPTANASSSPSAKGPAPDARAGDPAHTAEPDAPAARVPTPTGEEAPPAAAQADAPTGGEASRSASADGAASAPEPESEPTPTPGIMDLILDYEPWPTMIPFVLPSTPTPDPAATPTPAPTFDIEGYSGALPYPMKEKVELDEDAILPELKEIYALNRDLVGWLRIPDTVIDYPVVQRPSDSEFYLTHDFYGEENQNGQIILDPLCDPYTPSYNLVISGHHMKNGSMFGDLPEYRALSYWRRHPFLEFDTLMERKQFVVFAAFYSADYDEDEAGFRYNVNVRYRMDADPWLEEIRRYQLYDTGVDVKFGDEFITLTTCNRARHRNGRFVVVARRIREGETFE